jgi:3-oxoacyl-[acyl-carrier protein] reductase
VDPASQPLLLRDRVAIVTGAARGIGEAIALCFARNGADLAICDRDGRGLAETAGAIEALGRRAIARELDVRQGEGVAAFVAEAAGALGPIDVLVNNAGGTFRADFLELAEKGQRALVDENFTSVTHFVRAFAPHARPSGASILNLSSIEASRAAPGYAVYAAMKAAVENLTQSLALELAARRIRVNCIAPDAIPTPGIGGGSIPTPLPDPGRAEDVAGAALFLASDLSRFVTGVTLPVDGGGRAAGGWSRAPDGSWQLGGARGPA